MNDKDVRTLHRAILTPLVFADCFCENVAEGKLAHNDHYPSIDQVVQKVLERLDDGPEYTNDISAHVRDIIAQVRF